MVASPFCLQSSHILKCKVLEVLNKVFYIQPRETSVLAAGSWAYRKPNNLIDWLGKVKRGFQTSPFEILQVILIRWKFIVFS